MANKTKKNTNNNSKNNEYSNSMTNNTDSYKGSQEYKNAKPKAKGKNTTTDCQ
ncbi:MAG: hypothetical protein RSE93_01705 [Oscillospiraceae bacterium]